MSIDEFSTEQKQYLHGFVAGVEAKRSAQGASGLGVGNATTKSSEPEPSGPDAEQIAAQNRFLAEGKKLVNEEVAKREAHPFDIYDQMKRKADDAEFPKGVDVFRWKFHGLFYVAPAQDCFMCRLRIPNGIISSYQFRGVADLAESYGGGYSHVTTRANLQVRDIDAANGISFIEGLQDLGLTSRGSGADNIRNITGSPTSGIDRQELIDTTPYAKALNYAILNKRELYGLPRKFNIAFEGGGTAAVLEDTNDIGFQAVEVKPGAGTKPGIWFRLLLGGITGHEDFARDTGVVVEPDECVEVAEAVVKVFIRNGDRTSRTRARMKYVLDDWGFDKYLEETEKVLGRKLVRVSSDDLEMRTALVPHAHIGVHPQKQEGLFYLGVVLPVGHLAADQMRELAEVSEKYGDGSIRLTVWQNILISGISETDLDAVKSYIEKIGLHWTPSNIRGGLVACTGNTGCRFAASDTKRHAMEIADHVEGKIQLDHPVNIHLTGCHHSCAQHYIGDIGLLACKIEPDEEDDEEIEGYHIYIGGGFATDAKIGRELYRDVTSQEAPERIEQILRAYMQNRQNDEETFFAFCQRLEIDQIRNMVEEAA